MLYHGGLVVEGEDIPNSTTSFGVSGSDRLIEVSDVLTLSM